MISALSNFECITRSSSMSLEEIKLIAIVNGIFRLSGFLRLFIMSFKNGLILPKYSSTGRPLFLSPLLSYSMKLLLHKFLFLLVYNNLLFHAQKGS